MNNKLIMTMIGLCLTYSLNATEVNRVRAQFVGYHAGQQVESVALFLKTQQSDGSWANIDYQSKRPGNWPTRSHLDRLVEMARAYVDPSSSFFGQREVRVAVLRGVDFWNQNDYRNSNWYNTRIGVPYRLGTTMILMGAAVSTEQLEAAHPIFYRSTMGMTGQNKVWCAGVGVMKGLLYNDDALLGQAVGQIWSELKVSTGEGIQPDWGFHQHGPQFQMGNYGLSFGDDMVQWATVLRNTPYALSGDKLKILRNFLLDGASWTVWDGVTDYTGCGRQVDRGAQRKKAASVMSQLENMKQVDPEYAAEYERRIANEWCGFKAFWRSEIAIQKRSDWYASVKMNSSRVVGSESCNKENMQGLHQGDGVLLVRQRGDDYEDIVPVWDWNRLPGTTCDQQLGGLGPKGYNNYRSPSEFSGVLGQSDSGMAAMVYERNKLQARKSWFIGRDSIVCLGAGIEGETNGPVYTSIQQSWLRGGIKQGDGWFHHNDIGYRTIGSDAHLKTEQVKSNWLTSYPDRPDRPAEGDVFSLWIDHGKSPQGAGYAYVIYPQVMAKNMELIVSGDQLKIWSNTKQLQAIENERGLQAVFYESGKLVCHDGLSLSVDVPCMLQLEGDLLTVCDPTHASAAVTVVIQGKKRVVPFPVGADAGKQLSVTL